MTLKFFSPDRMGAILSILVGFLSIGESIKLYPYGAGLLTGDHTFPGLIGVLLVIAGVLLLFVRSKENVTSLLPKGRTKVIMISSIGILFVYCFLIGLIGYFFSTLLAFACLFKVIGNYRWIFSTLLSCIMTTILYFLFIVLLRTPFPNVYFSF